MNRTTVILVLVFVSAMKALTKGSRAGAVCKDGTFSDASGHGACSHHAGVKYWIHEDPNA